MSMHPGREAPTPTQSTCLYYDHDNEASKCVEKSGFEVGPGDHVGTINGTRGLPLFLPPAP